MRRFGRLQDDLHQYLPKGSPGSGRSRIYFEPSEQVGDEMKWRVDDSETVPASEKIVCLFEAHDDSVKSRCAVEFIDQMQLWLVTLKYAAAFSTPARMCALALSSGLR